jgi:hypothetical protein
MRSKPPVTMTLGVVITVVLLCSALRTTPTLAQIAPSPDRPAAPIGPASQPVTTTASDDWYISCVD